MSLILALKRSEPKAVFNARSRKLSVSQPDWYGETRANQPNVNANA
jgi:hypothetical protein